MAFFCFSMYLVIYLLLQLQGYETPPLKIVGLVCEILCSVISELQILSFLFMLGCVITHYKLYLKEIATDRDDVIIFSVKLAVEEYQSIQNSVNIGLFIIFSLQTVNLAVFIYLNITHLGNLEMIFWNLNNIAILIYIALVHDDVNEERIQFVDDLW